MTAQLPTDAELLEQARALLWELYDIDGAELHATEECFDRAETFCACPRVATFERIMKGWKAPGARG